MSSHEGTAARRFFVRSLESVLAAVFPGVRDFSGFAVFDFADFSDVADGCFGSRASSVAEAAAF
jgi:hypothetical protein